MSMKFESGGVNVQVHVDGEEVQLSPATMDEIKAAPAAPVLAEEPKIVPEVEPVVKKPYDTANDSLKGAH